MSEKQVLALDHQSGVRTEQYRRAERALWSYLGIKPMERFLDLPHPKLQVRVQIVGQGDPILFVHGGPNGGSTWAPLVARLMGFQCIILDRPGCGLSEPCDYRSAPLQSQAVEVLVSVLDALGLQQAHVVASSIGGWWRLWLARTRPERITRMVECGCPAFMPGMKLPAMMRFLATPGLNRFFTSLQRPSADSTKAIYRQIGHAASLDADRIPEAYWEWGAALMADTDTMANELNLIEAALTWRGARAGMQFGFDELQKVAQPTLFIWGDADPFGGIALAKQVVGAMPDADLVEVPDGGHLPWLDDAQLVAELVQEHLVPVAVA